MRRISVFATITFFAGLCIGFIARSSALGAPQQNAMHAADMAAIEKLHQADIEATLTQDPSALNALWSQDGVKLDVPGPPVVGIKALEEMYEKSRAQYPEFKVLKYSNELSDVQIVDEWAIEVGYSEATFKISAKDNPVSVPRTKGMRVLKRQSDGSWKLALVGLK
jgi:uncharacterized protein (TIGR02246 family)